MAVPNEPDADLDRLLRMADPGPGPDVRALVDEIGRAVLAAHPVQSTARHGTGLRRRWGMAAAVGVVAALLTATTAVAVSAVVSARTGEYGKPGNTENDTSEWLRTNGDDYREVVEELRPTEVPVPPGFSYARDVDGFIEWTTKEPASLQVTMVRGSYAFWAVCAWEREWLAAYAAGDESRRTAATAILREVPSWPLIVATDGGGTVDHLRTVAEAADRGDGDPVRRDVQNNCRPLPTEGSR